MKNLCFYFQVHQPFRLRNYPFFEIGEKSDYYDFEANSGVLRKVANKCYLTANKVILDLIHQYGKDFKVSYSISGTALDQFEWYMPEVLESFQALAATGNVEFLGETYAHSLAILKSKKEFIRQVKAHGNKIEKLFGQRPVCFRNTELVYADFIGDAVYEMGYKAMLTEGADRILGWQSPNFIYQSASSPNLKLLLKNYKLSDDVAFRFSDKNWKEWPLTTEKYTHWLNAIPENEQIINLFMDYETFGEHQWPETGIFDFLRALPEKAFQSNIGFTTPSEAIKMPVSGKLSFPHPVSWADEERDLSAWLGNDLQNDAFDSLYKLEDKVRFLNNEAINRDWLYLQTSDHFYYMCTKYFADGDVHKYFNPYNTPFEAFINYMNILTDFSMRLDTLLENQNMKLFSFTEEQKIPMESNVLTYELRN